MELNNPKGDISTVSKNHMLGGMLPKERMWLKAFEEMRILHTSLRGSYFAL
jgi:hypothetical protein